MRFIQRITPLCRKSSKRSFLEAEADSDIAGSNRKAVSVFTGLGDIGKESGIALSMQEHIAGRKSVLAGSGVIGVTYAHKFAAAFAVGEGMEGEFVADGVASDDDFIAPFFGEYEDKAVADAVIRGIFSFESTVFAEVHPVSEHHLFAFGEFL